MTSSRESTDYRYCVMITTTDRVDEAEALAHGLVENRLAACVQLSAIVSHYMWECAATRTSETLMLIKTRADRADLVSDYVRAHHSYDTPELIVLPIISGLPGYLAWIDGAVS